ncbi:hypothetical protein SCLCIDRAFT_1206540 [Scleroderma citrinum Foug A]|uniref:Uncharacterized protein n=1 Tax=Scleroderma citrinum Foug A TaxID=1036808 RepID=A0A0C3AEJ2_9AGAM|nr:hypothetical protein SCLCIDRAFT_1214257 [Scleroderma citrinum Foug A]KIM63787.1 hypothetical protein SCLCIDRAFT_1213950 [Scleroderma citrinum Foug A]KIM70413.1 hypothetical protein SCLCIDRAFT_1206540 [Scleroderma citrinum Foug A]
MVLTPTPSLPMDDGHPHPLLLPMTTTSSTSKYTFFIFQSFIFSLPQLCPMTPSPASSDDDNGDSSPLAQPFPTTTTS